MIRFLAFFAALSLLAPPVFADKVTSIGRGNQTCKKWTEARKAFDSTESKLYEQWVLAICRDMLIMQLVIYLLRRRETLFGKRKIGIAS